jgi:hypothetical protein
MNSYQVFDRLSAVAVYGGGLVALALLIDRARTGAWSSPSTRFFAAVLFFIIPAGALFRLLARPLTDHSVHSLWLQVGVVLIWLAAGAANAFRMLRSKETRGGRTITNQAMERTADRP